MGEHPDPLDDRFKGWGLDSTEEAMVKAALTMYGSAFIHVVRRPDGSVHRRVLDPSMVKVTL